MQHFGASNISTNLSCVWRPNSRFSVVLCVLQEFIFHQESNAVLWWSFLQFIILNIIIIPFWSSCYDLWINIPEYNSLVPEGQCFFPHREYTTPPVDPPDSPLGPGGPAGPASPGLPGCPVVKKQLKKVQAYQDLLPNCPNARILICILQTYMAIEFLFNSYAI